eukprot:scaffold1881_cov256-Pinguiococcus_pyrenoidosus.AAC.23
MRLELLVRVHLKSLAKQGAGVIHRASLPVRKALAVSSGDELLGLGLDVTKDVQLHLLKPRVARGPLGLSRYVGLGGQHSPQKLLVGRFGNQRPPHGVLSVRVVRCRRLQRKAGNGLRPNEAADLPSGGMETFHPPSFVVVKDAVGQHIHRCVRACSPHAHFMPRVREGGLGDPFVILHEIFHAPRGDLLGLVVDPIFDVLEGIAARGHAFVVL